MAKDKTLFGEQMNVTILSEAGYDEALFGLGLSHGVTSGRIFQYDPCGEFISWCTEDETNEEDGYLIYERMKEVAERLAGKGKGHDKFLRQICVWLDITAPRYWWPEMDQYKVATVTQSESTMHTIHKKEFTADDFAIDIGASETLLTALNNLREQYIATKDKSVWKTLIQLLPQSYLQRRILTCNYETLRNILIQRTGHRLSEWAVFIDAIKSQAQHPEFLNV